MKTFFKLATFVAILVTFSCENESLIDQNSENQQAERSANAKKVTRPISNSIQSDDFPEAGPLGGFNFYGTMTHMGQISGIGVTTDIIDNEDGTFNFISDDIIVGANGDQVHSTSNIRFIFIDANTGTYTGGGTITGGTGRFEGASGYLIFENATYDLLTGHASHQAIGEITY